MSINVHLALVLALIWGCAWAAILQFTRLGRFLVHRRTWITVVIGVGVDLVIAAFCMPFDAWFRVVAIVAVSSVGIVARSLFNEWVDMQQLKRAMNVNTDETGK